ncbi:hypothetical protein KR026_001142 [Drosophila bipectinata]|nr:hypothetical protein KR026_001142 [Drosophila bipectinata]
MKLIGREKAINGTFEFVEDIPNEIFCSVNVYSDAGTGGFKLMPLEVPPMPICDAIQLYYERFVEGSLKPGVNTDLDLEGGTVCPIPKGKYYIKKMLFDTSGWAVVVPRGLIKVKLNILDKEEFVGGIEYVVEIKDKIF